MSSSAGKAFRAVVQQAHKSRRAVQVLGAPTAYAAMQAERAGAPLLYLSGSGVATVSYGLPDLGVTSVNDVVADVERVTRASRVPLMVDIDTGFGTQFCIQRCIRDMVRAGAGCVHMEDQEAMKRCGHRPGKAIVSTDEMVARIRSAVQGRTQSGDDNFVLMARTDALASEGMTAALKRCEAYVRAGADMLFPEAFTELEQYRTLHKALPDVPLLANITEFGKTPLFSVDELSEAGVSLVLYPLSAQRAMARAAQVVYESILANGHQRDVVDVMQTRAELYEVLNYHRYEQEMDALIKESKP